MAKLTKTEAMVYYYEVELTDEQLELYKTDEDAFWEEYEEIFEDVEADAESEPGKIELIE